MHINSFGVICIYMKAKNNKIKWRSDKKLSIIIQSKKTDLLPDFEECKDKIVISSYWKLKVTMNILNFTTQLILRNKIVGRIICHTHEWGNENNEYEKSKMRLFGYLLDWAKVIGVSRNSLQIDSKQGNNENNDFL